MVKEKINFKTKARFLIETSLLVPAGFSITAFAGAVMQDNPILGISVYTFGWLFFYLGFHVVFKI